MALVILGSANRKKARELADLFSPTGLEIGSLADIPGVATIEETGKTFAENAALKAAGYARQLAQWVLADDSGLAVDALGGEPGVFSARYAGPDADDAANNQRLLEAIRDVPLDRRTAEFRCHIAVADPTGAVRAMSQGVCHGRILFEARGSSGFGYDPLFEIMEYHRTFAELGPVAKSVLSHRARALQALLPVLAPLVAAADQTP